MRARRGLVLGWVVVGLLRRRARRRRRHHATTPTCGPATVRTTATRPRRSSTRGSGRGTATFVRTGTFERRSEVTGAVDQLRGRARAAAAAAPAPPARRRRRARRPTALIVCPAPPDGDAAAAECRLGEPGRPDLRRGRRQRGRRAAHAGRRARRPCTRSSDGRRRLLRRSRSCAVEPRAPFGDEARFCFDEATGAPTDSRVRYAGGHRRGRRRHRTSTATVDRRRPRARDGAARGDGGHGMVPGPCGPGSMLLEGVATPVPFPC